MTRKELHEAAYLADLCGNHSEALITMLVSLDLTLARIARALEREARAGVPSERHGERVAACQASKPGEGLPFSPLPGATP